MKQKLILWIAAFLLTFLTGYFHAVLSPDYPISGTIGIQGKRVSYRFEKIAHIKDTLRIILTSDIDSLKGKVIVFGNQGDTAIFDFRTTSQGNLLRVFIPIKNLPAILKYRVTLFHDNKEYPIPANISFIETKCIPNVPDSIWSVFYFTLFGGLLLSIRTGLDYFNESRKTRKFTLFTTILFNLYGFFVIPVKNIFELNILDKVVVSPSAMFSIQSLSLGIFWIIISTAIFKVKNFGLLGLLAGIITILLFIFWN